MCEKHRHRRGRSGKKAGKTRKEENGRVLTCVSPVQNLADMSKKAKALSKKALFLFTECSGFQKEEGEMQQTGW